MKVGRGGLREASPLKVNSKVIPGGMKRTCAGRSGAVFAEAATSTDRIVKCGKEERESWERKWLEVGDAQDRV